MTDEYWMARMDDLIGEQSGATIEGLGGVAGQIPHETFTDSKPRTHPLWALIDVWGGQIWLSADQLKIWRGSE